MFTCSTVQGLCHCARGSREADTWGIFEKDLSQETPLSREVLHNLNFSLEHEMKRAFGNGVCRADDVAWLSELVEFQCSRIMPQTVTEGDVFPPSPLSLSGIPTEIKQGEDHPTSTVAPLSSLPEVTLHPVFDWIDLHLSLSMLLKRYREEVGVPFILELTENNMQYIMKLHRALKFSR